MKDAVNRRLNVCIIVPKLQIGGAEVQVLYLVKNLDRSIFRVMLCSLTRGDEAMEREAAGVVDHIYHLDFRWRKSPVSLKRLVDFLKRERIDIVHGHLPLADFLGRIAGRFASVPIMITTEHGKHLWKNPFHLAAERLMNHFTDARICVSRDIMDIRMKREGTPESKLRYIPNAVDVSKFESVPAEKASLMSEFGWRAEEPFVVSVGRLVEAKNYPLLIDAIDILRRSMPDVRCLIVGEGDCREHIEERISERNIGSNAKLAGERRDVARILAAADVFVLSSIREGLPVSLLEAMAAGKAVVATEAGGIPDAVNNEENGILVPVNEAEALARALQRVLADEALRERLASRARKDVAERFSAEATARMVGDIYVELASAKGLL